MAEVRHFTEEDFEAQTSKGVVLVDFWAEWCGPCKMLGPVLEQVATEVDGKAVVGKVNVDEEPELAGTFQVTSIPTVVILKNGKIVNQSIGYKPKEELVKLLEV